jgi:hypothetical protein
MQGRNTIIVEDRLKELFAYLPEQVANANSYKPVFKVGDEQDLFAFFKQSELVTNYPLVWLQMPYDEEHTNRGKVQISRMTFILAVETNVEMLNDERMELTFKPILYPLLDNIIDIFRVGNTISHDGNFSIVKFTNYSNEGNPDEGKFVDVWDAIKLTIDVVINDSCLREIKL